MSCRVLFALCAFCGALFSPLCFGASSPQSIGFDAAMDKAIALGREVASFKADDKPLTEAQKRSQQEYLKSAERQRNLEALQNWPCFQVLPTDFNKYKVKGH